MAAVHRHRSRGSKVRCRYRRESARQLPRRIGRRTMRRTGAAVQSIESRCLSNWRWLNLNYGCSMTWGPRVCLH